MIWMSKVHHIGEIFLSTRDAPLSFLKLKTLRLRENPFSVWNDELKTMSLIAIYSNIIRDKDDRYLQIEDIFPNIIPLQLSLVC